jgi:hypothetical protein
MMNMLKTFCGCISTNGTAIGWGPIGRKLLCFVGVIVFLNAIKLVLLVAHTRLCAPSTFYDFAYALVAGQPPVCMGLLRVVTALDEYILKHLGMSFTLGMVEGATTTFLSNFGYY